MYYLFLCLGFEGGCLFMFGVGLLYVFFGGAMGGVMLRGCDEGFCFSFSLESTCFVGLFIDVISLFA